VEVELFEKVVVRISDVKEESTGKRKVKLELGEDRHEVMIT
jgi:exosome complex exonuclease DIS3/RRP44